MRAISGADAVPEVPYPGYAAEAIRRILALLMNLVRVQVIDLIAKSLHESGAHPDDSKAWRRRLGCLCKFRCRFVFYTCI